MKYFLCCLMVYCITTTSAQPIDSIAMKQVDSLIQVSRALTGKSEFDQALQVNAAAEKIALEILGRESAAYGSCAFNRGRVNHFKKDYPEAENGYLEAKAIRGKTLGVKHRDYASCLYNLAVLYRSLQKFEAAEQLFIEAVSFEENVLGVEHPNHASRLMDLASLYAEMGLNDKAEMLYLKVIDIRKKVLGEEHLDYLTCLFDLAGLYYNMSNFEKAESLYIKAKAIQEKVLGVGHPNYATIVNNLANLYMDIGHYDKAEALYIEAIDIKRKSLGMDHPYYANSLVNLAVFYSLMSKYEEAEPLYLETIALREKVLGAAHPEYAQSMHNLAILYLELGRYEKAEPLYLQSIDILKKALGTAHPYYASSLYNLAIFYKVRGEYEKAESNYLEAITIQKKVLGPTHLDYAKTLNSLATFYHEFGDYKKAETFYLESKAIRQTALGVEHPFYATNLNNLATLYSDLGHYEKAESFFFEARAIREKVLGVNHPVYAESLHNLGSLYWKMDDIVKAEPLFLQAKAIREKVLGVDHPDYAESLFNLGSLYWKIGDVKKAEPLHLEACAIWKRALGEEHPTYAKGLSNLASLYENQFRYTESTPLFAKAVNLMHARITGSASFLSEQELATYVSSKQGITDLNTYLFARPANQTDILPALSYNQSLFQKGFLLHSAAQLQHLASASPEAIAINHDLKSYRRRIAQQLSKPISERKDLEELEEKANHAEKELARSVAGYTDAIRQVKLDDVKAELKQSEAAIEFIHFKVNFPSETDSTMYAALLLLPGAEQPKFIPLFEEKALELLVSSNTERKADYVNELYTLADRGLVKLGTEKSSLYELIWKPLEDYLAGIKTIYYSPSGLLHRINIDAIPVSEMETIADKYQLISLNSTRQIVIPTQIKNVHNDAILFGGIQFEQDSTIQNNEALLASRSRGDLSFTSVDSTLRGGTWNYLAGTEREVNAIEKIMQTTGINTTLKKGYEATEESFKHIGTNNASSPRILHIATHGYFFPDPKSNATGTGLGGEQESVFKISDHPMLRSGLIMAGGNAAWQGNQTLEGREDGILTAYEISQMNLSNTELVVLSACETGLGEIQGNEGVYGLQRAFKIAGAKYLIMSLWQVPDKQTSLLMTTFYKKWLEAEGPDEGGKKMNIPEAFHAAQKELREIGLDPYQWAGFVLVE